MNALSFISMRVGVTALALTFATPVFASDYPFVIRGNTDVKAPTAKIVYLTAKTASSKATSETVGKNIGYSISNATVWKYVNGVLKETSKDAIKLSQELVLKGNKIGSTFVAKQVIINDRTFDIIGKVKDIDTDLKTITVLVVHSTYRESGIKNKNIKLTYDSKTACKRLGSSVGCSTVANKNQIIKGTGEVSGETQVYNLKNLWDNFR